MLLFALFDFLALGAIVCMSLSGSLVGGQQDRSARNEGQVDNEAVN